MELSRVLFAVSIVLLFVCFDVVSGGVLTKPQLVYTNDESCRENEVYSPCQANRICEKSCDNIDVWDSAPCIQTKNCVSGCICDEGYVRDKNQGICVLENSCPRVRH